MKIDEEDHGQDNAMIDDLGQVFFADNEEDAATFARDHGARPVYPERWPFPELP